MVTTILFENPYTTVPFISVLVLLSEQIKISTFKINCSKVDVVTILILKKGCLFSKFKTTSLDRLFSVFKVFSGHQTLRLYRERCNLKTKSFLLPDIRLYPAFTVFISTIRKRSHDFFGNIKSLGYMFSVISVSNDAVC